MVIHIDTIDFIIIDITEIIDTTEVLIRTEEVQLRLTIEEQYITEIRLQEELVNIETLGVEEIQELQEAQGILEKTLG